MFEVKIDYLTVPLDGDSFRAGEQVVGMSLRGFLPFAPFSGLRIEARSSDGVSAVVRLGDVFWEPAPGGNGHFEVFGKFDTDAGIIMTPDDFKVAFEYMGWAVEQSVPHPCDEAEANELNR